MATGLTAFEKYTDSWRLDHPDFQDVRKTTYSKATITDFQKVSDDPIKVSSMVKVEIEGQAESDYLPLWYCPKEGYWDTTEFQARDVNQDGLYYENAWMSFRAGDEVKVLLMDGVPTAVVGFADGVLRRGEDVAYIFTACVENAYYPQAKGYSYVRMQSGEGLFAPYTGNTKGPDNLPLHITGSKGGVEAYTLYDSAGDFFDMINIDGNKKYTFNWWLKEILLIVGPIAYILEIADYSYRWYWWWPVRSGYIQSNAIFRSFSILAAIGTVDLIKSTKSLDPTTLPTMSTGAGGVNYNHIYPGFTQQSNVNFATQFPVECVVEVGTDCFYGVGFVNFFGYQPPHTKAELQAAGMWPEA